MLKIHNVCYSRKKARQEFLVLDHISLSFEKGKIYAIVGPNGCGKTTLSSLIAGYLTPDSGTIMKDMVLVNGPGPDRVVISQEYDLFDWMTVQQNLALIAKEKKVVDHYINLMGLAAYRDYYPKQLSGGLKKRLSIARALSGAPDIIILDEAFAFLDAGIREDLQKEVLRIRGSISSAIVLITHDINEAMYLADNISLFSGPPLRLVDTFENTIPIDGRETFQKRTSFSANPQAIQQLMKDL